MLNLANKAKMSLLLFLSVLFLLPSVPVHASSPLGATTAWIRARLTYEYDEGVSGLTDDCIHFSDEDKWEKGDDGWYYYTEPVKNGDTIRFMEGVNIPTEWTNDMMNKKFRIIVQVEASECMDGNQGFVENEKSNYSESFEVWSVGYEKNTGLEISSEGNMKVEIHEYELNSDGKQVPYENDKVILPGQEISKIVEFELTKKTIASDIPTGDISILGPAAATAAAVLSIGILTGVKVKKSRRGGDSSCGKGL